MIGFGYGAGVTDTYSDHQNHKQYIDLETFPAFLLLVAMSPTKLEADDNLALPAGAIKNVPPTYIDPISNAQTFSGLEILEGSFPIIDLEALHSPRRSDIIGQLGHACQHYGFFLVKNHGIQETMINDIIGTTREFFHLPDEEKMKSFTPDPSSGIRHDTAFQDKTNNVFVSRESLKFPIHPLEDYVNLWPSNPASFRKIAAEYFTGTKEAEIALMEAIFESLGMERDSIDKTLSKHGQYVSLNYYPRCVKSELGGTCGLRPHTDPSIITMLLLDDVPGLEVLQNDEWMAIKTFPNTLVVQVGDLLQALSNCRYKSLLHRVIVNPEKERLSIATNCHPSNDTSVGPPKELIDKDSNPAIYKNFTYKEFFSAMWQEVRANDSRLDSFKINSTS
ncbi:unnamed protein product [Dovyalis caffra]|uniref:Fe2OG dioxygenase domain-containing protein n=1 Tax=Dovyalis caffra TaxID=77055 RepID=A0AAV1SWM0_9ROSI|nr:unnamed protein product [Dovyalis caffra]